MFIVSMTIFLLVKIAIQQEFESWELTLVRLDNNGPILKNGMSK